MKRANLHIQQESKHKCSHTQPCQVITKGVMQDNGELWSFRMVQSNIQMGYNKHLPTLPQEQKFISATSQTCM